MSISPPFFSYQGLATIAAWPSVFDNTDASLTDPRLWYHFADGRTEKTAHDLEGIRDAVLEVERAEPPRIVKA